MRAADAYGVFRLSEHGQRCIRPWEVLPNRTSSMASLPKRCFREFVDWAGSAFKLSSESFDSKSIKLDIRTLS
jgi:hypothetical protein